MARKKKTDWPYPRNYNHLLGYCEGKHSVQGEGIKVRHIDRTIKDGKSLNK